MTESADRLCEVCVGAISVPTAGVVTETEAHIIFMAGRFI
jgi:hypothetical protein